MNNDQFRRLVLGASASSSARDARSPEGVVSARQTGTQSLGSRQRASIPPTPRAVKGGTHVDFARQATERNRTHQAPKNSRPPVPRGVRLADGYVDRASERISNQAPPSEDDRESRIKALEESRKKGEIDQATFEMLRDRIAGGDLSSTHLVKGLDFRLLERVRRGEDVYNQNTTSSNVKGEEPAESNADIDDELDQIQQREVAAVERIDAARKKKHGQLSTVSNAPMTATAPGKRTRNQILAELKAARAAAAQAQQSALGSRFKKIGARLAPGTETIERDVKGRRVKIIIDDDGHEHRTVLDGDTRPTPKNEVELDKDAKVLGMEVPEAYRNKVEKPEEEDDDTDIFAGVGNDYDPLAGLKNDSDSDSDSDNVADQRQRTRIKDETEAEDEHSDSAPPAPKSTQARNYFQGSKTALLSTEVLKAPAASDPALLAAIKRAPALKQATRGGQGDVDADEYEDDEDDEEARRRREKHRRMLESIDRDEQDMDMGFGTNRLEDEEDFDGDGGVKLSRWGDEGGDGQGGGGGGGGKKRKRGPKKKKGDANNVADVMRLVEERKKGS